MAKEDISVTTLILKNGRTFIEVDSLINYLQINIQASSDEKEIYIFTQLVSKLLSIRE